MYDPPVASCPRSAASTGAASLEVAMVDGCSALIAAHAVSPLKLLAPRSRGPGVWVFVASYGGGLVAGDATALTIRVGPEACCLVGTQASTEVYRNPTPRPCTHTTRAAVADGALLVFAPDPVQAFADAAYEQRQSFDLAPDASLVSRRVGTRAASGGRSARSAAVTRCVAARRRGCGSSTPST